jgi:hypothetical protein
MRHARCEAPFRHQVVRADHAAYSQCNEKKRLLRFIPAKGHGIARDYDLVLLQIDRIRELQQIGKTDQLEHRHALVATNVPDGYGKHADGRRADAYRMHRQWHGDGLPDRKDHRIQRDGGYVEDPGTVDTVPPSLSAS